MWPPPVVVGAVSGEDAPQVPFAEDQDTVGELGSDGQHESFGEAVRPRAARRDLHGVVSVCGQDGVERGGELAGPVADEEPERRGALIKLHQQVAGLLGGPRCGRMGGGPEDVHIAVGDFDGKEHVDSLQVTAQSTWKKSTASMVAAWTRRNRRQDVSVDRRGAGGIRRILRIRRMVEAPTRWPSLRSSPWMR